MKNIKIKQRDYTDCGAACLASVAEHYHLSLPVARIRQYASTDKKGTNVLGLVEAATRLGFDARGVRGEESSLAKIPKPAIAHIIKGSLHHFVVIYKVSEKSIEVMDPADGQLQTYTRNEFTKIWSGVLVILLPGITFARGNSKISATSRFLGLVTPHRSVMIQALFGALIYTLIGLSTSIYVQKIVDYVLPSGNRNLLNLMGVAMMVLLLLQSFIGVVKNILIMQTGQAIDTQLILGYYKHLLKLPQSFFDSMRVGEIISRINDAVKIRSFVNEALTGVAVSFFVLLFSIALMFTYYWKLAVVVFMIVPVYLFIYFITNKLNRKTERKVMEQAAELEAQLVESMNAVSTIKSFGLENHANQKTEEHFFELLRRVYRSSLNTIFTVSSSEFFSRLFTIVLLWAGAGFVVDQEITPGELLSFYALIGYFTGPVGNLLGMNKLTQNALIAADRLFEIFDLKQTMQEDQLDLATTASAHIQFRSVSFRYGTRADVFQNLTLEIPGGQVTAILGESGSGKSTLVALIQNLYPLQSGHIYIGDYDVRYIKSDSLKKLIATVPQKIDLFAGTIIYNIAIGDSRPDMKRILDICRTLGILEFIESLPQGFHTYLGENGTALSGGQRQRIAIARALYRDPEILILDEATASLDSVSEHFVQKAIQLLRQQGKTVIVIAHRLSTVRRADKIIVLNENKVAEEGTHVGLLKAEGIYFRMWKDQSILLEDTIPLN